MDEGKFARKVGKGKKRFDCTTSQSQILLPDRRLWLYACLSSTSVITPLLLSYAYTCGGKRECQDAC